MGWVGVVRWAGHGAGWGRRVVSFSPKRSPSLCVFPGMREMGAALVSGPGGGRGLEPVVQEGGWRWGGRRWVFSIAA